MDLDILIARASPPPERGGDGPFISTPTDPDSWARREDRLLKAFGSRRALGSHAETLGLSLDAYLARFGDVRLEGPTPDWGRAFREIFSRLADTEAPFSDVYSWARSCAEAEWPDGLPRGANALDGAISHLEWRFRSILTQTMRYEARLGVSKSTWEARLARSPALAYALGRAMVDWRSDLVRMLRHAANDRAELSSRFFGGGDPGLLISIEHGLGDPHAGGRSVAILRFANGSVVFKPKDLRIAGVMQEIVGLISSVDLSPPSTVPRAGYAWETEYAPRPVTDTGDADRFYQALGGWLALLQTMNATDFWFDNLIADGPTPRFVDFETVLQPTSPWPPQIRRLVDEDAISFSMRVANVGILPLQMSTREGLEPTDLGCLCQPGEHRTPMKAVEQDGLFVWKEDRYAPRYESGDFADSAAHFDALEDGYLRVSRELGSVATQDRILAALESVPDAQLRFLLIDTWTCYRIVQESLLPSTLSDGVWREIALHKMLPRYAGLSGALREAAVRDMRRLDIPLFLTAPASRDLLGVEGEARRDAFEEDAIATMRAAFGTMTEATDRERLAWLRSSFSARAANPPRRTPVRGQAAPAEPGDLLAWADQIATEVQDLAVTNDCGYPTWIGMMHDVHFGRRFLAPLSIDILSGRAGIARALLELGERLGRTDLAAIARETLRGAARDYAESMNFSQDMGVGYAVGVGGLLQVLAREPCLREDARMVYRSALEKEAWMRSGSDFVSGLAGWKDAALALGGTVPERHGPQRPYAPSALPRLAPWLDPNHAEPVCADRRAATRMRRDRDQLESWFAERWIDDRHDLSGIDGTPALAVAFARLASVHPA